MNQAAARSAIGMFYLGMTTLIGVYILVFKETRVLPIPAEDANSAFQIIIPTFIAQLTAVFKWYSNPPRGMQEEIDLPRWVVYGPLSSVAFILLVTIGALVLDSGRALNGGEIFKNAVTFCVSVIGATTVFVVAALFQSDNKEQRPDKTSIPQGE